VISGASDGNIFVVKLSYSGNYVWGETFGGVELDIGYGLAVDSAGRVALAGTFGDIVDFDPSPLESRWPRPVRGKDLFCDSTNPDPGRRRDLRARRLLHREQ
jgi:hypothetical protein